jgi:hypothetical protein
MRGKKEEVENAMNKEREGKDGDTKYDREIRALKIKYPGLENHEIQEHWPIVKYQQKPHEETCIYYSMASALHFMASVYPHLSLLTKIASNIFNLANDAVRRNWKNKHRVKSLKNIMKGTYEKRNGSTENVKYPELVRKVGLFNAKANNQFDPFDEANHKLLPTLAICESVDRSVTHAVTFFGNWVFDSNEKRAFPITTKAMNRCVPYGFKRVICAYRFGKDLPKAPSNGGKKRKRNPDV